MSKKRENKYDPSFIHANTVEMISKVRQYGIKKHGDRNDWITTPSNEHFKSAMRHLLAAMDGEPIDEESGLPHIAMCITNLCFELERGNFCFKKVTEVLFEQQRYKDRDTASPVNFPETG